MLKRLYLLALASTCTVSFAAFHSSIPVVDMALYEREESRQQFIEEFTAALHDIGFCAIVNTGLDEMALDEGYKASIAFFSEPLSKKVEIHRPELNGQRGLVLSENAQGHTAKDIKEFFHMGYENNLWPSWMNLQGPMEKLMQTLDEHSFKLQKALSIFMGQEEDFLKTMTQNGDSVVRALHYPQNPNPALFWAAEHTDIDLFTILPMSTEKGLQVLHNGEWIDVQVPSGAFIINCGDMLENISNGYFKSSVHRVVSQKDKERFSIVYFVHPRDEDSTSPLSYCIEKTGGVQRFPSCNHLEMLAHRLVEIGIASDRLKEYDASSGYMDRVQELVDKKIASPAVQKTYAVWQSMQK